MPVNVEDIPVASWEDVFLTLTTTACRRVAPEYAAQVDFLLEQGLIAAHPQQPEYYYVTAAAEWNALKEKREAEAAEWNALKEKREAEAAEMISALHVTTEDPQAEATTEVAQEVETVIYVDYPNLSTEGVVAGVAAGVSKIQNAERAHERKAQLWAQAQEIVRQQKSLNEDLVAIFAEMSKLP